MKEVFKKITFILAFILSCQSGYGRYEIVVDSVEEIHPFILKGDSFEFSSPVGSYQTLFKSRNLKGVTCLIYKVPLRM